MADNLAPETVISFVQDNPKKAGLPPHARYELYKVARTIEEAKRLGATKGDISNDFKRGFFETEDHAAARVAAEAAEAAAAAPGPSNNDARVAPKRVIADAPTPMKKQKTKDGPEAPPGEKADPVAPGADVVPVLSRSVIQMLWAGRPAGGPGAPVGAFEEAPVVQMAECTMAGKQWICISDGDHVIPVRVGQVFAPRVAPVVNDIVELRQWSAPSEMSGGMLLIDHLVLVRNYTHTIGEPMLIQQMPPQRERRMWTMDDAMNFCRERLNDPSVSDMQIKVARLKISIMRRAKLMPPIVYNSIMQEICSINIPPTPHNTGLPSGVASSSASGREFRGCVVESSGSSGEDVWLLWCHLPVLECHQADIQALARESPELAGPPNAKAPVLLQLMLGSLSESLNKDNQDSPFGPLRCLLGLFAMGLLEVRLNLPARLDLFLNKLVIDEALPGMPLRNNLLLRQLVSLRLQERTSDMIPPVAASCASSNHLSHFVCPRHMVPGGLMKRVKGDLRDELAPCVRCMMPWFMHNKIDYKWRRKCVCGHEGDDHSVGGKCVCCVAIPVPHRYGQETNHEWQQKVAAANPLDSMFRCQELRVASMGSFELYKKEMEPVLQHFPKREFIIEGDERSVKQVVCQNCNHDLHHHAEVGEGAGSSQRGQCGKVVMKKRMGQEQKQPVPCSCQCFKAPPGKGAVNSFAILAQAKPQPLVPIDYPQKPIEKFVSTLRPYQEHAVNHMVERENNPALALCKSVEIDLADGTKCHYNDMWGMLSPTPCHVRGGFLLSDMGLGKTVMSLALVMRNGVRAAANSQWAGPPGMLKGGTLIVVPPILVRQWVEEIEKHVEQHGLKLVVYCANGNKVKKNWNSEFVAAADIIVAASSMINLRKTENDKWSDQQVNPLSKVWFHRVIVDEAHATSNSIQDIYATNRWLLSGTPFGTSTYSSIKDVLENPLRALFGTSVWHFISDMEPDQLETWVASLSLRHEKEDTYSDGKTAFLELPAISYDNLTVEFSTDEARIYKEVKRRLLDKLKSMELLKQPNWRHFLNGVVLRMRQLASDFSNVVGDPCEIRHWADAPQYWQRVANMTRDQVLIDGTELERRLDFVHVDDIQKPPLSLPEERAKEFLKELEAAQPECSVCMETIEAGTAHHPTVTRCGHLFCGSCILEVANHRGKCPQCRAGPWAASDLFMIRMSPKAEATESSAGTGSAEQATESGAGSGSSLMSDPEIKRIFDATRAQPSSKLKEVVSKLQAVCRDEPAAKFLLFSTFEQTRVRLERELKKEKLSVLHVSSSMSPGSQAGLVQKFSADPDCTVLLLSTQVASVGLNLTAANHIFFIDHPLSLTQQKQAVGRCHRIGQGRPVTVWSFITGGTIEAAIASAAATQLQEAIDGHEAAAANAGAEGQLRKARGRNLLGKEELLTYFELAPEDIYDPLAAAAASR